VFRVFFNLIHGHRAVMGGMDGMKVLMLSLDQLITNYHLIGKILQGHPFPNVDLVVQSVAE